MNTSILIASADPPLGKVDKASLSQHTLMELLIQGIENKEVISGSPNDRTEIARWKNLSFRGSGEVTRIRWGPAHLNGSIHLEWLPLTVTHVEIWNGVWNFDDNVLTGTLDLTNLPEALQNLVLTGNQYFGEIDLTTLPAGMLRLDLSYNNLSGSLDLTKLPGKLQILDLQSNCFLGKTDFSNLPESLHDLNVSNNTDIEGVFILGTRDLFFSANDTRIHVTRKDCSGL